MQDLHLERLDKVSIVLKKLFLKVMEIPECPKFMITHGLRTREEQLAIWLQCHDKNGLRLTDKPWTTNLNGTEKGKKNPEGITGTGVSRHQSGDAVDIGVILNERYDPNAPFEIYHDIFYKFVNPTAIKMNVNMTWGGNFSKPDAGHFERNRLKPWIK